MTPDKCPHCGDAVECITPVIAVFHCGSDAHGHQSDLCRERAARQRAEAKLIHAEESLRLSVDYQESLQKQLTETRKERDPLAEAFADRYPMAVVMTALGETRKERDEATILLGVHRAKCAELERALSTMRKAIGERLDELAETRAELEKLRGITQDLASALRGITNDLEAPGLDEALARVDEVEKWNEMNPILKDCKVETVDTQPYGGQHVGSTHVAVRVTHIPSGISVTIGAARSQMRNRNIAAEMIEWALLELNGRGM